MAPILLPPRPQATDAVEAFRQSHLEISRLFSDRASDTAYSLYEVVEEVYRLIVITPPVEDEGGSIVMPGNDGMTVEVDAMFDAGIDWFTDLQNILEEEMHIG